MAVSLFGLANSEIDPRVGIVIRPIKAEGWLTVTPQVFVTRDPVTCDDR